MGDTPKERFVRILEEDAKQFEKMAENLQALLPHLGGGNQHAWAIEQIALRQSRAKELRILIELVQND